MNDKERALADLRAIFNQWKELVSRLREPELTAPLPGGMSVKDTIGHLLAWQQLSIARFVAAQSGNAPLHPVWVGRDPEDEAELEANNARIQEMVGRQSWPEVYRQWREGFLRLMALAEAVPEAELVDRARFPWLNSYSLYDVLVGSWDHHREHLEGLV